jgi:hypothetical protein
MKEKQANTMQPCGPFLYEFLFRGRAPHELEPPAWHVGIQHRLKAGEQVIAHTQILNMAQAIAAGWDLKAIAADINTQALAELELARLRVAELERDFEQAGAALVNLRARVAELEREGAHVTQ